MTVKWEDKLQHEHAPACYVASKKSWLQQFLVTMADVHGRMLIQNHINQNGSIIFLKIIYLQTK